MSAIFSYYNTTTGQIAPNNYTDSRYPNGPPPDQLARMAGYTPIAGVYDSTQVLFDLPSQSVLPRGACPVTSIVSARVVTLAGVPSGAAYTITGDGSASGVADASGTLALTFGAPGTYNVAIVCFPLLDYQGSFTLS